MRILYVITDLEVGGVPLHLLRLASEMKRRGRDVSVASLGDVGPVGERLPAVGIDVHACGGCCGVDVRVLGRLKRIIRVAKPDVVHSMLFHANVATRWAGKRAGVPGSRILCEIQTVEVERKWHLLVDRFTHRGCRFTIGNSPSVVEHLHSKAGIPRERLRLVRGGIDAGRFDGAAAADRKKLGLPVDARMILWVGRLDPVKGLDVLIRALAKHVADPAAHLVLVGDGPIRGELERLAAEVGVGDRVHFVGRRDDVASLLAAADVFAFPSRTEGLPNALLEAMASRRAIVTTDVPGCRDLVEDGRTGLIVPYGDAAALGGALSRVLGEFEFASRIGEAARREVQAAWSIESMFDAYEAHYADALA